MRTRWGIPTVKINNKEETDPRKSGRHQLKQYDHEIEVNAQGNDIQSVMIRFGNLLGKDKSGKGEIFEWNETLALPPVKQGQTKIIAKVDADQLPADAEYFQILCEIVDKHKCTPHEKGWPEHTHPEMLVLDPTPLNQARKHQ